MGSSSIKIGGECTIALATSNLLLIPPDNFLLYDLALSLKSINFSNSFVLRKALGTLNIPECKSNNSSGVKKASIFNSCGTMPTANLDCFLSFSISIPQTDTSPELLNTIPDIIFINVDLPAPFGPNKPKIDPAFTFNDTSSNA